MSLSVVIGASRGLGLEFVRQLRAAGREVVATARDAEGRARIEALGAATLEVDVRREGAFHALATGLADRPIDLVILNAGYFGPREGATLAPSAEEFDRLMRTNVYAALQAIPLLAPRLAETRGRFIAISSDMASIGGLQSSMGLLYRASKAALNMVIRAAAQDHKETIFLAQSPGWVRTDMGGAEAPLSVEESVRQMLANITAAGRDRSGAFLDLEGRPQPW